jgi:hypothetical protein
MSAAATKIDWRRNLPRLLAATALIGILFASANLRSFVLDALAQVNLLSVLVTLPLQAAAIMICAVAFVVLKPGIGYWPCLGSRLLRDASNNLPIAPPGVGEALGVRVLTLAGGQTRTVISATALDKLAEGAAQIPFILLAIVVLWSQWRVPAWLSDGPVLTGIAAAIGCIVVASALWWRFGSRWQLTAKLAEEWNKLIAEARGQRQGLPLSIAIHFVAWLASGVQIWMAAWALGYDLSLYEAIAVESAAYAGRALFFFVPAGLVSQEAGLVAAGLVVGLTAPQALALGLVLRLRDLVFGLPLIAWPMVELRHARQTTK